ncbi:MAG: DUF3149 domain-containing protein [Thermoplasmata archaeon]|nr:MAG: DUF3149 domain-containing protein [Thermoplasmata archaeon]HDH81503.1 DUF3149 domain-containing protein [Thermoplasmatales archaeon]MCD6147145.1 hypothetical protein [Thermoplasmata archaeon]RLF45024.1 MAG: hypothetical protein DRN17_03315 [Thermoplasmata archaeon]RLF48504.1 MAG: hypothetical protein DRN10_02490 [Thermoplasmata archaeon]
MNEKINAGVIVSVLSIAAGLIFYIGWNAKYGAWTDVGIYSITAILVAFGIGGYLLSTAPKKEG